MCRATPSGTDPEDRQGFVEIARSMRPGFQGETQKAVALLNPRVGVARDASSRLVEQLVKNGPSTRTATLEWFAALLNRSADATAMRAGRHVPLAPTRLAAAAALLRLCRPFCGKLEREENVRADLDFLGSDVGKAAFPDDLTRVNFEFANASSSPEPTPMEESDDEMYDDDDDADDALKAALALSKESSAPTEFHFVTQCFFLCTRALHLGLLAELPRLEQIEMHAHHEARQHGWAHPRPSSLMAQMVGLEAICLPDGPTDDAIAFSAAQARWLLRLSEDDLRRCPEHVLEDVADLPSLVARHRPRALVGAPPLEDLLKVIARCLGGRDKLVKSPHARDKLARALYECFLPNASKHPRDRAPGPGESASERNVRLLLDPADAAISAALAPALLWLFGDAEHLGYYDIEKARVRVAALVRHLWGAPKHRAAFRSLAGDKAAFTTFANGLLNETNEKVASAMEHLPAIRDHQIRTGVQDPGANADLRKLREEYQGANEARREEIDERHAEARGPRGELLSRPFRRANLDRIFKRRSRDSSPRNYPRSHATPSRRKFPRP